MHFVGALCDRVVVLNFGRKIAEGNPEEVRANRDVREAYLGAEENQPELCHAS
jgi:ABC-type branched-subunit amino acid transport system ATPase component